jgi:hypothetical protein
LSVSFRDVTNFGVTSLYPVDRPVGSASPLFFCRRRCGVAGPWIDQNRLVSDDWRGTVVRWARDASGSFAASKVWSTGGQALGIGVSPDKTMIVTGGAAPANLSKQGFVFLFP